MFSRLQKIILFQYFRCSSYHLTKRICCCYWFSQLYQAPLAFCKVEQIW